MIVNSREGGVQYAQDTKRPAANKVSPEKIPEGGLIPLHRDTSTYL